MKFLLFVPTVHYVRPNVLHMCSYSHVLMELWFRGLYPCVLSTVCCLLHPTFIYILFCLLPDRPMYIICPDVLSTIGETS